MRTKQPPKDPAITVRVFMNGGSQAVTIPRNFRISTSRARVGRRGDSLIITPVNDADSWDDLWKHLKPLDDSFRRWPTGRAEKRAAL